MTDEAQKTTANPTMEVVKVFLDIRVAHTKTEDGIQARTFLKVDTNAPVQNGILASLITKVLSKAELIPSNASKLSDIIAQYVQNYLKEKGVAGVVPNPRRFHFEMQRGMVCQFDNEQPERE